MALQMDGTPIGSYARRKRRRAIRITLATFTATASSSHTLSFVGTDANGGDNTVFIDNVRMALAPSLTRPQLSCQIAGGQMQLLWPTDHTGWELQVQTIHTAWVSAPTGGRCPARHSPTSSHCGQSGQRQCIFPRRLSLKWICFKWRYFSKTSR